MPVPLSQFQGFIENPPTEHARTAFLFRQAQAKRAQAESGVAAAEKALEAAKAAHAEAIGYQKALQDVITFAIERENDEAKARAMAERKAEPAPEPPAPTPDNGATA